MGNSLSRGGSTSTSSIRPTAGLVTTDDDHHPVQSEKSCINNPGFSTNRSSGLNLNNGDEHSSVSFLRNQKNLGSMRSSKYSPKIQTPLPNPPPPEELEKRFTKVLVRFCTQFSS